jgi:multicomponent Na+:H+ antiporter subunit B
MFWELEISLFLFLLFAAIIALEVRDLLAAVVSLSIYSFISALLFVAMGAVDVGFTEAVVGAGITGVLFIVALYHTPRKSVD